MNCRTDFSSRIFLFVLFAILSSIPLFAEKVNIVDFIQNSKSGYGIENISASLKNAGIEMDLKNRLSGSKSRTTIIIGINNSNFLKNNPELSCKSVKKEGFRIKTEKNMIIVSGADENGVLYGCLELAERIAKGKKLPEKLDFSDAPEMTIRGTCIGLQKTEYLPGRNVYEYPYTPENFPWFYDRKLWIEYLDMMARNRFNALYLWNGHPFASLVKLKDYPYALEVDEKTYRMNEDIFSFLTTEAEKRGIWVIQMFYNIIISKPFAEKNGLKTQDRERPVLPLISDYTRKSISAFIEKYPNVGLLVCLGEAINTIEDDVKWFTETIIPGVKDGLARLGKTKEPPIVLRGHDTDAPRVMKESLPLYKNLYTMHKYNGESLTTWEPRDSWATIHQDLSRMAPVHISNVHILANLEPFRYGSPDFIQNCVKAMHAVQKANGLHLYPQASYWDWPYTADKTVPRLLQAERDWIWYSTWGRYAWNCNRDKMEETVHWTKVLGDFYKCGEAGKHILECYNRMGDLAPKLLRRFGISDGNRQTLLLGMFMSQLVNPYKWNVYSNFYTSNGPEGEILEDFARKEWKNEPHKGELPLQIIEETLNNAAKAVLEIEKASPFVTQNRAEFERLKNDAYCYQAFTKYFAEKVYAALLVLKYKYSVNVTDLEKALPHLEKSVEWYSELVNRTKNSYLYANSMQTQQRRIPISGRDGQNKTWMELLPHYQKELENFRKNIEKLKDSDLIGMESNYNLLNPVNVEILNPNCEYFNLVKGSKVLDDKDFAIEEVARELSLLKGIRFSDDKQQAEGTVLRFKNYQKIKILVGYFNTNSYSVLPPPTLETNASANDRGQADIRIANALRLNGLYPVNIYTYLFEPGENELILGKGRVMVLGFIDGNIDIQTHDAGISEKKDGVQVDWLFY